MRRTVMVAAMIVVASQALAGSPYYETSEAQKRKIVVPDIRALTNCVAGVTLADPDGAVQYRAGLLRAYVARQLQKCPQEMSALLELYESTYGDGEAERFIKGPYLADLPRAVLSVIRPQLDAKVDLAKRAEEYARQQAEDARTQAQVESAALAKAAADDTAAKQRFIDKALRASDPPSSLGDAPVAPVVNNQASPAPSVREVASATPSLGLSDMPFIVDTYKKNEMRFVRDFKGKHFDSDMTFANTRQNIIISGSYTVIFGKGGFADNLTCETSDPKQIGIIADWDKGDAIHVSGDIRDVTFGDLQLSDCLMQRR